jgi:hypothetical protein
MAYAAFSRFVTVKRRELIADVAAALEQTNAFFLILSDSVLILF